MKEVKFRAWDKINKRMVNDIEVIDLKCGDVCEFCIYRDNVQREAWYKGDNVILMQYTGLKDDKDVEVFEGDIIKSEEETREFIYESYGVVKWSEDELRWIVDSDVETDLDSWYDTSIYLEVQGNIYEHPKFIEEMNDWTKEYKKDNE